MSYLTRQRKTPQSAPLEGQVANSAQGFSWAVDDWARLRRFLILGSEGGSYYAGEWKLTRENADAVQRCLAADGARTIATIVEISARNTIATKFLPASRAPSPSVGVPPFKCASIMFTVMPAKK